MTQLPGNRLMRGIWLLRVEVGAPGALCIDMSIACVGMVTSTGLLQRAAYLPLDVEFRLTDYEGKLTEIREPHER